MEKETDDLKIDFMYINVHSDLMSKGPSEREGQIEIKKAVSKRKPVPRPKRAEVADTDTDTDLSLNLFIIILYFLCE